MSAKIPQKWIEQVIVSETSPIRFEHFCNELFTAQDQIPYVSTSIRSDQGVDGRCLDSSGFIATTIQQKEIARKAADDVKKMVNSWTPSKITFCSSQRLLETDVTEIISEIRKVASKTENIGCFGAIQIADLTSHHPEIFLSRYRGEYENLRDLFAPDESNSKLDALGMRIALTTQLDDDAQELRSQVTQNLILTVLQRTPNNIEGIAHYASNSLHLPKAIRSEVFRDALCKLEESREVTLDEKGVYQITEKGKGHLEDVSKKGEGQLLKGRALIKSKMNQLNGTTLYEEEFDKFWNVLEIELARLFMQRGLDIVDTIAAIQEKSLKPSDSNELHVALDEIVTAMKRAGLDGESGYRDSIFALFRDPSSEAFNWLTELGTIYVATCSLGLEPSAQHQMRARLAEIDLILDTDMVLSLLSEGEYNHRAVVRVIREWQTIGGRLFVTTSVLEEAAHHAWNAQRDYEQNMEDLPTMNSMELRTLVSNAFVRGYHAATKQSKHGRFTGRNWSAYILQFKGHDERDYNKISEHMREYGIEIVDPAGCIDQGFAEMIGKEVLTLRTSTKEYPEQFVKDLCARDGILISYLDQARKSNRSVRRFAVILSSSSAMSNACRRHAARLGTPEPVMSLSTLAYFLALIPGVRVELEHLKSILFDTRLSINFTPFERLAFRSVKRSAEYSICWGKSTSMRLRLRERIDEVARSRGQQPSEFINDVLREEEGTGHTAARIIADVMDEITVSKSEKQLAEKDRKIQSLEAALNRAKAKKH